MDTFARILLVLVVFLLIEGIDYAAPAISLPWWLSLLMAAFLSISDIITIFILDWITDDC